MRQDARMGREFWHGAGNMFFTARCRTATGKRCDEKSSEREFGNAGLGESGVVGWIQQLTGKNILNVLWVMEISNIAIIAAKFRR